MAIMQGDLAECPVPDLLQFLHGTRKGGQLLVESGAANLTAGVYFANGQIVHAYCPPREGPSAIYQLLKWQTGNFAFLKGVESPRRTIEDDIQNLLLEGLRQLDEFNLIAPHLPPAGTTLYLERDSEKIDNIRLNRSEWKTLSLVNGRRTVAQVLEMSGPSEIDAARTLYGLIVAGLVVTTHDDSYLEAIVPRKIPIDRGSKRRAPPPTILGSLLLNKIDGARSLRQLKTDLGCGEKDLVEEFRLLVRTEWIELAAGEDAFRKYLAE